MLVSNDYNAHQHWLQRVDLHLLVSDIRKKVTSMAKSELTGSNILTNIRRINLLAELGFFWLTDIRLDSQSHS